MSGIVGSRFNIRGSGLVGKLGTDGQVFTSAGAGKSAVFEDGGKILQVIQTAGKGAISTTSTSYVTSGLEVAITPSATSSKILVMLNGGTFDNASNSRMRCAMYYKVTSGGTYALATIYTSAAESHHEMVYCPSERGGPHSLSILHAPSSTSELYYAPYYKTDSGTGFFNNESAMGINLIAMEIGA